jgi:hypothetical protein
MGTKIDIETLIIGCNMIFRLLWSFCKEIEKISLIFTMAWNRIKTTYPKYSWKFALLLWGNKTLKTPRVLKYLLQPNNWILMLLFYIFPASLSWVNYSPLNRICQYFSNSPLMMSRSSIVILIKYYRNMRISLKNFRNFFMIIIYLPSIYLKVKVFEKAKGRIISNMDA